MKKLLKRKNIRLNGYDYSQKGYYFITICTQNRECLLSNITPCRGEHCSSDSSIISNSLILTLEGKIVDKYINEIPKIYKNILVDEYIIMPNHIHFILVIEQQTMITISKIVQQFKGKVSKELKFPIWQKLFYEHIIRNEEEYWYIKEYIKKNPDNWELDIEKFL